MRQGEAGSEGRDETGGEGTRIDEARGVRPNRRQAQSRREAQTPFGCNIVLAEHIANEKKMLWST